MSGRRFFRRANRDAESARDIRFYLDTETEDNLVRGMTPEDARAAARRKLGNPTFIQEEIRLMNSIGFLENLWRDLLCALRTMRKSPAFAVTAVLTLALGIGANTAIFSVIRAVLLKPLEYHDPDQLVRVSGGATSMRFEVIRTGARSYSGVGAYLGGLETVALAGGAGPEVLKEARVSANFLRILGVEPMLGRGFQSEEDAPGGPPVAIISAELWRRRFGGDPSIAGLTATLAATPHTIVGVMPAGFQFPFSGVDVWVTKPSDDIRPLSPVLAVFARLRPGVGLEQASAELAVLNRQYAIAHPGMLDTKLNSIARVTPLKDELVAKVRSMLWMLFGAVGFVLLIACANVASLLLARATSRSREFAVRAAIGAGRWRLIEQLLAESVLLAFAGGALGVLLAKWSLSGIARMTALDLPRAGEIRLDGMVLGFAAALSIATGVLFGLVPALGASRPDLAGVLRASGEAASSVGSRAGRLWLSARGALVVVQVALSIVLLIGAALLMESLAHVYRVDLGFRPANLLTMQISLPPSRYGTDQKKAAFYDELVRRVESLPGVRSATVTLTLPLTGFAGTPVQDAGQPPVRLNERLLATIQIISPAHFRTLEIPLRRGREFTVRDKLGAPPVAIIAESLARRLWPAYPSGKDPVGQRLLIGANLQPAEIVGVVADVHQSVETDAWPGVYRPSAQNPFQSAAFVVRTDGDPLRFVNAVRSQVLAIDPDQPVSSVATMEDVVEKSEGQRRLIVELLGLLAGAALLLAVVGMYGVIAYSVVQRTKEIGIRRALGAQQRDVLSLVIGQGVGLTLAGVALGIVGAFALTRVMQGLLFQVSATDRLTYGAVSLLFLIVALVASYIPARRAARIDPMAALRE
jgi:putative ABC transport system permease protein